MSVTPTYPGVYITEPPSPVHTIVGVATSITAFVGYTAKGIDGRAQQIFGPGDYQRLYGGLASDSELSYAVQQFFDNGGTEAYVVRVKRQGAASAMVQFSAWAPNQGVTAMVAAYLFSALSSGAWANGNLLLEIDYNGVDQTDDPTQFNLTVTDVSDNTVESFDAVSLDSARSNYLPAVLNDPDIGSQLVNVSVKTSANASTQAPPAMTGTVGSGLTIGQVALALCGTAAAPSLNVTMTAASPTVTVGAGFLQLSTGQFLNFSTDTQNVYTIASIISDTQLTLTTPFAGANGAATALTVLTTTNSAYSLSLSVWINATAPAPLPLTLTIFQSGAQLPASLSGLANQIGAAFSGKLAVQMSGASFECTVVNLALQTGQPQQQALRITGSIPQYPDAVFVFTGVPGTVTPIPKDATTALEFTALAPGAALPSPLGGFNVASYAMGMGAGHLFAQQTLSTAGTDGTQLPNTGSLIGDPTSFTGIYALEKVDLFNILCIPEATRALPGSPTTLDPTVDPNSIYSEALTYCARRRAFLLIDSPPNITTVSAAVDWRTTLLTVNDPNGRAATYFPRLRLPDPMNDYQLRTFAPCGVVSGLFARIDGSRGVWKAPAGIEATLTGVQALTYKLTDMEQGVLNPVGLNCSRTFPVYGTVMWGARTIAGADALTSEWKYVPVRRLALFIEESLYRGTQWVVFEPNDEPLWASIRLNVGTFMQQLFLKGAFQGMTADQAYFVKCDSDTTSQADIDSGIVNILVGFAPLNPAEFVIIQISQIASQAQS